MPVKNPQQVAQIESFLNASGLPAEILAAEAGIKAETLRKVRGGHQEASELMMTSLRLASERESLKQTIVKLKKTPQGIAQDRTSVSQFNNGRMVPIVSWASCGKAGDYADLADQIEEMVLTECKDPNAFALFAEGDSMEPEIHAGDILIFSPNAEPRNKDIVVARLAENHGVLLKRFMRTGPGGKTIVLLSENLNYDKIELPQEKFRFIYPIVDMRRRYRR